MAVLRSIGRGRTSQSAADETAVTHSITDFDAPLTPGEKVHVLRRRLIKQRRSSSASKSLHRRIRWTFGALVVAPVVVTLTYLNLFATPQYYASVGFTVRSLESSPPEDLLTGFTGVTTARSKTENDIIFRYLESGEIVDSIESRLAIKDHYSRSWVQDPIFLFPANGSFEQLVRYWQRSLDISYDPTSGLFDLRVRARSPEWAVVIAQELLRLVDGKVEELSRSAFKDAVRHSEQNLRQATDDWNNARIAIEEFRLSSGVLDPALEIESRMGLITALQAELAGVLVERGELSLTVPPADPRLARFDDRIGVINDAISRQRAGQNGIASDTENALPRRVNQFEALSADLEFAAQRYQLALAELETARSDANRGSSYLSVYLLPVAPQSSEFPNTFETTLLIGVFSLLIWAIFSLVYLSLSNRR